mgnify:CR=1 FL=1
MQFWCCVCKSMKEKEDFWQSYQKEKMNTGRRCAVCARAYQKELRNKNLARSKENAKRSYLKHRDKALDRMKTWTAKNPSRRKEILQRSKKRERASLSDSYVASALRSRVSDLPKELLEAKRVQIMIYRHIKETK